MDPSLRKSGEKSFESSKMIFGETTRFLHSVWVSVLGSDKQKTVREPDITRLFHAVEIYPSKSQVPQAANNFLFNFFMVCIGLEVREATRKRSAVFGRKVILVFL